MPSYEPNEISSFRVGVINISTIIPFGIVSYVLRPDVASSLVSMLFYAVILFLSNFLWYLSSAFPAFLLIVASIFRRGGLTRWMRHGFSEKEEEKLDSRVNLIVIISSFSLLIIPTCLLVIAIIFMHYKWQILFLCEFLLHLFLVFLTVLGKMRPCCFEDATHGSSAL